MCQQKENRNLCFSSKWHKTKWGEFGQWKNQCFKKHQDSWLNLWLKTKLVHPNAIEKATKAKQALRILSGYFSTEEIVKLSTALFYSQLYYGAKIWLTSALSAPLKKKLWQASSKMLKICPKDWLGKHSFKKLHKISNRATPKMWSNYSVACWMFQSVYKKQ